MDSKFNMLFCLVLGTSGLVEVAEWPMPSRGEWISPVTVTAVAQRQPRYCLVRNGMITVQQILSWREFYVDHIIVSTSPLALHLHSSCSWCRIKIKHKAQGQ